MPYSETLKTAKNQALRYLSYRDRSALEVTQYLEKKEHTQLVIQQALDALIELNYVNDQRFALEWGRYKINKQKLGKNRLYAELLNKGIDKKVLENTLAILYEDNPETELAIQCARKKMNSLQDVEEEEKKKRRLIQYLKRRGFSSDIIYQSINNLSKTEPQENHYPF
jgi:regulatory protein